ncbi:MAG: hypothetical protein WC435_00735 [Candidatus Paceibacterota bacterium]
MNNHKAEVLVAYTRPEMWRVVQRRKIANQAADKKDAKYIAFLLVGRKDENGNYLPSAITHIAKVKESRVVETNEDYFKEELFEAEELANLRGWKGGGYAKEYILCDIEKLPHEIVHRKGKPAKGRVCFYTKLSELEKVNFIDEIKTESHLEKEGKVKHI